MKYFTAVIDETSLKTRWEICRVPWGSISPWCLICWRVHLITWKHDLLKCTLM